MAMSEEPGRPLFKERRDRTRGIARPSIVIRFGLAIAALAILALVSILLSIVVTDMSSGEARAINVAGSLRMQSYAIGVAVVQPDGDTPQGQRVAAALANFEARYRNPALVRVIPASSKDGVRDAYQAVGASWEQFRSVALQAASTTTAQPQLLAGIAGLAGRIDRLVDLVEERLESKLQVLRFVQVVSLVLLVIVGTIVVHQIRAQVLVPLGELLRCADRVRRGDFSVRVGRRKSDELGQLGEAFNFMVQDLSQIYANLEARVRQKTEELARSNQSLELLYGTTRTLSEGATARDALLHVLNEVERVTGVQAGAICIRPDEAADAVPLAADMPAELIAELCGQGCCGRCIAEGRLEIIAVPGREDGTRVVSVPLSDGTRNYGVMPLVLRPGSELLAWQLQLVEAVGRHIGAALAATRRHEERHRLALLDERSVIARELHDSLAQSLSYLKIQVARLQSLMPQQPAFEGLADVVDEIRGGLNDAYRQLRELLTTFRLRIDGRGLNAAIDDTVQEFARRAGFTIRLDNGLVGNELASSQEIHVLQVIREALSNIEHHAHAREACITLGSMGDGRIRVSIEDDGSGLEQAAPRVHHYGMEIMRDRARSLGGGISVGPRPGGGTRVELEFPAVPAERGLVPSAPGGES